MCQLPLLAAVVLYKSMSAACAGAQSSHAQWCHVSDLECMMHGLRHFHSHTEHLHLNVCRIFKGAAADDDGVKFFV